MSSTPATRLARLARRPAAAAVLVGLALLGGPGCVTLTPLEEARAHAHASEWDKAQRWYEAAIQEPAYREDAVRELVAMDLARANEVLSSNPEEALRRFRNALRYDPGNEQAIMGLGRLYMRQQNWSEAVMVLADARSEGCSACKTLLASIYFHAGEHEVKAGDFHLAGQHFDDSIRMFADPQVMIAKATIYTVGNHGGWEPAVTALSQAGRRLRSASAGAYQSWLAARRDLFARAARNGELPAIDAALGLPDPRPLSAAERAWELELAELEAAALLVEHGQVDEGATRALRALERAREQSSAEQQAELEPQVVALVQRQAAAHMRAGEIKQALAGLAMAREKLPDDDTLALQEAICFFARNTRHGEAQLAALPRSTPQLDRARAIGWAAHGITKFDEEQYPQARKARDRAAKIDPALPEVFLLTALLNTEARLEGLAKWEFEAWREVGSFKYPGNRVVRSATARAQLEQIGPVYGEAQAAELLRAPDFDNRYRELGEALAYYPYEVAWVGDGKAHLELWTEKEGPVEARVAPGKRMVQRYEVTASAPQVYSLGEPEYVVITAGGQDRTVFIEPDVKIRIQI